MKTAFLCKPKKSAILPTQHLPEIYDRLIRKVRNCTETPSCISEQVHHTSTTFDQTVSERFLTPTHPPPPNGHCFN